MRIPEWNSVSCPEVIAPNVNAVWLSRSVRAGSGHKSKIYLLLPVDELVVEFGGLEIENLIEIEMRMLRDEVFKANCQLGLQLNLGSLFGRKVLLGC